MKARSCPECHRSTNKTISFYMALTSCETCKKIMCGDCWMKHYIDHNGKSPERRQLHAGGEAEICPWCFETFGPNRTAEQWNKGTAKLFEEHLWEAHKMTLHPRPMTKTPFNESIIIHKLIQQ